MDIQLLKKAEVQDKLRSILGAILIKEGLTMRVMSEQTNINPATLTCFLKNDNKYRVGIKSLLKIAHFVTTKGYELDNVI